VGLSQGNAQGGYDDAGLIQTFIAQTGVTFPMAEDFGQSFSSWARPPAISPFPLDIVIDREGKIVLIAYEYEADVLRAAVEAEL
jgi:peroxiredoxin